MKNIGNILPRAGAFFAARWFETFLVLLVLLICLRTEVSVNWTDQVADLDRSNVETFVPRQPEVLMSSAQPVVHTAAEQPVQAVAAVLPVERSSRPTPAGQVATAPTTAPKPVTVAPVVQAKSAVPVVAEPVFETPTRLYPRTIFLRHPEYADKIAVPADTVAQNLAECHAFVEANAKSCYARRTATGVPVSLQLAVELLRGETDGSYQPSFNILSKEELKAIGKIPVGNYQKWAEVIAKRRAGLSVDDLIRVIEALDLFLFDTMA